MPANLLPDILCLAVCAVAAVTDVRAYRIPNWLTLPAMAAAITLHCVVGGVLQGWPGVQIGLVSSLAGLLLLAIVFGIFGAVKMVGMGDVKLMAAVGAFVAWPLALWALVYVTLAGGILGLLFALLRGRLGETLRNIGRVARRAVRQGPREQGLELTRVPYALAILSGTAWAVASRYFSAFRVI